MTGILLTQNGTPIIGDVAKLMGWIMNALFNFLDGVFGIQNIGLCIILFTIIIYLLMLPLTIKQQKFSKFSAKMNPELTASWEKGLNYVAEGSITPQEYMDKLEHFVRIRTDQVEQSNYQYALRQFFDAAAVNYQKKQTTSKRGGNT